MFDSNILPDDRPSRFRILVCKNCLRELEKRKCNRVHSCGHQDGICYMCNTQSIRNTIYRINRILDQDIMLIWTDIRRELRLDIILDN
jgi:hypothetical protein